MIADPESGPPSSAHTHYKWDQGHLGLFFKASTSDRVKMQKKKNSHVDGKQVKSGAWERIWVGTGW